MNKANFNPADMRLLLVDDTPENLDVLNNILKPLNYNIAIAKDGEQAIKVALHFNPDLVLLDIMMPGIDGFETCRRLKSMDELKDVPVIFVTAKNSADDIVNGFQSGGADYINKPFYKEEVYLRIETHLNLRVYLKRLAELSKQKNKFLGIAAHDLRNPLSATIGLCDCVLEGAMDISSEEEKENIFSTIKSTSHEMLALVNDLLDTSAIENGTLVIRKDKASLRDILQKRIDIANYQAIKKEISIDLECENSLDIQLDAIRIGQVIDNLIGNAVKFSPKQSAIHVFAKQIGKTVEVSIQDQGPGIPENEQGGIFDDFHTLSTKSTNSEKSTGLGMSIVKKIIDQHNGKIRIGNNENQGVTIVFSLPAD